MNSRRKVFSLSLSLSLSAKRFLKTCFLASVVFLVFLFSFVSCKNSIDTNPQTKPIKPTLQGIELSCTDITVEVGETKIIKINLAPEEYKESYIVYPNNYDQSLISLKITKVSPQSGIIEITGLASGDTALCFKAIDLATDVEFKATANVHSIVSQTGIAFAEKEVNLNIEETNVYQIQILRVPDNATSYNYDSIEFKSSDENIASVDSNGLVICKNIGKATISAKTNDDKFQASFEITVNAYPVLEFKSKNPFTIKSAYTKSDGTPGRAWNDLIYSGVFPSSTWQSWVGEEISAVLNSFDNCYYLYLRGSNNTRICQDQKDGLSSSGSGDEHIFGGWKIKGEDVYCSGDIRALLKYKDVENSVVGTYCFAQLF